MIDEYFNIIKKYEADPLEMSKNISPQDTRQLHHIIGLSCEANELLTVLKARLAYKKPIDRENIKEEFGDLFFYFLMALDAFGFSLEEIITHNLHKLDKRYPCGFEESKGRERKDKCDES